MSRVEESILAEAAAWHAASETDEMDWEGFTAWLEADPRHRLAYDETALADSLLADHRNGLSVTGTEEQQDEHGAPRPAAKTWRRWAGAAIAASLLALLIVPNYFGSSSDVYETDNAARSIALNDGSSVILAPHSRLAIEGKGQEQLTLTGGAWFDIIHDPDRPLTIAAGATQITDIGTQFDVQSEGGNVRVEVADGKVEVASQSLSQPIRLVAGKALLFDGTARLATVSPVASEETGEWRSGRLSYNLTPLPLVADDLARYAGISVKVPDSLGSRRFSGTLVIGDGEAALRDLSQVMELALYRDADGFRLDERGR